jgi:signal transduction histidine kinase
LSINEGFAFNFSETFVINIPNSVSVSTKFGWQMFWYGIAVAIGMIGFLLVFDFANSFKFGLFFFQGVLIGILCRDRQQRAIVARTQVPAPEPEQTHIVLQQQIALQQQNERERLITLITQRLRRSLNLDEILSTTVIEVREFFQADRAIVYQFNPDWSGIVVAESTAPACHPIVGMTNSDPYFGESYASFFQQGGLTAIADVQTAGLDPHYQTTLEDLQVRALLIVPIVQRQKIWGLLVVHQCTHARQWETLEVNLLRRLANQLAVAVQQSELYQQVQQLNNNLEQQVQERTAQLQQALEFEAALRRITDRVRDSLDENNILYAAVQELALALNVQDCSAARYDLQRKTATIEHEYTTATTSYQGNVVNIEQFPEIYNSLLAGNSLQYCSLSSDLQPSVETLVCPIFIRSTTGLESTQDVLGDLWLSRYSQQGFSESEIRLVQQVANQCAIALRQARLYKAAQAQVEELARLNYLKDDFLSTVSHELRTPMANIKMATQMLDISLSHKDALQDKSNKIDSYLQILQHESQREIGLINDLLDLSRLEAGTEPLILSTIRLQDWIPHILESFVDRVEQQQQQLQISIDSTLPPITTDLSYLERILAELLQNAHKYTPSGETIAISALATDYTIQIRVSNSGVEIPQIEHDRIFDKFYRIPNNDPWKSGGTGLGLALVKRLVTQIGATIAIETSTNRTTFVVAIDLATSS